jgi:uncharacterized protein YjdB
MKKIFIVFLFFQIFNKQYGQIIADHTVIDKYNNIPQYYIDQVKKMWMVYAGESHSAGIRGGLSALEALDSKFAVNVRESGIPDPYTSTNLRTSRATWGDINDASGWIYSYGEEDWFTSTTAINRTKAGINYCYTNNLLVSAIGFGWCWDNGIDFNAYISATQSYFDYCSANNIPTKVFFTTGTVDTYTGSSGYTKHLGYESIRQHVKSNSNLILFDYADILCYDDGSSTPNTTSYNGSTYPVITSRNVSPEAYSSHISSAGAVRLAKAMWWMLARIAGWDGGTSNIPVTGITVSGAGGSTTITTDNGTLQLSAAVSPSNATNRSVTWSLTNGTGQATITSAGLVTAMVNGTVTARATANDGSGVYGTLTLTITNQVIPVMSISITGQQTISTDNGTSQLTATVLPSNASNKSVTWTIASGSAYAAISQSGLVTATGNGTVTVRATANDGSGIYGTFTITISNQVIPVTGITVTGAGGSSTISIDNGTLQLSAVVQPSNATNKNVTWSVSNGTGSASINSTGLLTALTNGTVTARATAADGSGVSGSLQITITNQFIHVTGIVIIAAKGSPTITIDNGTLQLSASITPSIATNQTVTWSIQNKTGRALIDANGLVTAESNGIVTVSAIAKDGSGISASLDISISNQIVSISEIRISAEGGSKIISNDNGLQLYADILPDYATNKNVIWSVINGSGSAEISSAGLLKAITDGSVTVMIEALDGSGISASYQLEIRRNHLIKVITTSYEIKVDIPEQYIDATICLFNLNGTLLKQKKADASILTFDISGFPSGIYIVTVNGSYIFDAVKVIKL